MKDLALSFQKKKIGNQVTKGATSRERHSWGHLLGSQVQVITGQGAGHGC